MKYIQQKIIFVSNNYKQRENKERKKEKLQKGNFAKRIFFLKKDLKLLFFWNGKMGKSYREILYLERNFHIQFSDG